MKLFLSALAVFIINIPFGYWRGSVKRFSYQWFFAVHIPVILVILLRIYGDIGYAFYTYIIFISVFFLGQKFGSMIFVRQSANK